MKRGKFIWLASTGVGMCLIPSSLYYIAPEVKKYAVSILKRELYYLKLDPEGVRKYVEDYFDAIGNDTVSKLKWKMLYYFRADWRTSDRIKELMKYFLLSSDFFINRTDENKIVNYLGLFNSYRSPIPNPYSFVIYSPGS